MATGKDFDWGGFEQVNQLQAQNGELLIRLDERDREIAQLRIIADAVAGAESDVRDKKIMELSKKNRNVTLELEREKAKVAKLKSELAAGVPQDKLAPRGGAVPEHLAQAEAAMRAVVEEAAGQAEASAKEAADWREKYSMACGRLNEEQHKAGSFKQERDRLARALQRELGEDVPVAKVMEDSSDWKGRAQQISLLKDKVRDLKLRLGEGEETRGGAIQARAQRTVERIESDRKKGDATAEADLEAARAEAKKLKEKCDATQARVRMLESDVKNLREKLKMVVEKTNNDDKLIGALKAECAA
eukprot:CAMPEP_0182889488 /NCGR_PEP_ID=MMETSP0034_2-20130328/22070_1 /TAXON_ID=156128 /ORGANISM="Nephroselmis pyriformis, Strain CCMP717" /LENGTH=302 /DNA_ID=CAMNT_0025022989 /DNA_START=114 /DNA_END=1019 /DNA_ORIENTATION=+